MGKVPPFSEPRCIKLAITINQIAEICGVSRGTVDRALHNKGNVRPAVAEQIKKVAAEYGYTPNRAGMALSRAAHPIRLGIVLHSVQNAFVQALLEVCRREAQQLSVFSTDVIFRLSRSLDPVEQVRMVDDLVENHKIDGLAIMPLNNYLVENRLNDLAEKRKLPIITFNTDLPDSRRLCYVGQDSAAAGRTAAALMRLATGGRGLVSPIVGPSENHSAYTNRLRGFQTELCSQPSDIQYLVTRVANDDDDECTYHATLQLLRTHPDIAGIYAITSGYEGACRALIETGLAGKVHLILHDEIPSNLQYVRDGVIDFVLGQDAEVQGTLPMQLLSDLIHMHRSPEKELYHTDIRILFRYNIDNLL